MPDPILSSEKDKLELQVTAELLAFACTYYLVRVAGAEIGIEVIKDSVDKVKEFFAQQNQQAVQKAQSQHSIGILDNVIGLIEMGMSLSEVQNACKRQKDEFVRQLAAVQPRKDSDEDS